MRPSPSGRKPGIRVRFIRGGIAIAEQLVFGTLLEVNLPSSVNLVRHPGGIDFVESSDPTLECCGRLALPWVHGEDYGVEYLNVPPPRPFSVDGVRAMWEARNRLRAKRRPPTSADAAWASLSASLSDTKLAWTEMRIAANSAMALLAEWPTDPVPTVNWVPFERARGRILIRETERSVHSGFAPATGSRIPTNVATAAFSRERRKLNGLAIITAMVAERISVTGINVLGANGPIVALSDLFRRVSAYARPAHPNADPPTSTWPAPMRILYSASIRVLTQLDDIGSGESPAPLSELWELYEAWVTERLLAAMSHKYGEPMKDKNGNVWRWLVEGEEWAIWDQPVILPQAPQTQSGRMLGRDLVGIIGASKPDVLLGRRVEESTSFVVIDAKKRKKPMTTDDLTVNASKYLWNIRDNSLIDEAIVDAVHLISPLGGPVSASRSGRAHVISANPSDLSDFSTGVLDLIMGSI